MKELIILGSTGSIGTQTLNIVRMYPNKYRVVAISCGSNIELFNQQIAEFQPKYICVANSPARKDCIYDPKITTQLDTLEELVSVREGDMVVTAVVGVCGLKPTAIAIANGKDIALANKETLVAGGEIIMRLAKKNNVQILPVDSEHSAIWQSMNFGAAKNVHHLILTASGGAFRGKSLADLQDVTLKDALSHPTWSMGSKVTIDSATLMNKGLEVIEAKHLFDIDIDKIEIVVHKESIIHSLVAYDDSSIIAQLSYPDMQLPIQLALSYPERIPSGIPMLDLAKVGALNFERPDTDVFRCLEIARTAGRIGGMMPAIMNSANEIAVRLFIDNKIKFLDIPTVIESTLARYSNIYDYDIDCLLAMDSDIKERLAREYHLDDYRIK